MPKGYHKANKGELQCKDCAHSYKSVGSNRFRCRVQGDYVVSSTFNCQSAKRKASENG
jgi:tRNA(Ile2) C34 agmatinyltransferase TiaS